MANNHGITGGIDVTLPIAMTIGAFTAIAWVNCIELNIRIWMTFKRFTGLYFYSLVISSWGIMIYALAFIMKFFQVWRNDYISVTLITIGWYTMVTGQSLVLYSRLHLVVRNRKKIKWVLYMIIVNVFLLHFPTTVLTFGSNSPSADLFVFPYSVMEKIQITAFAIQEFIISGLYLYETRRILKPTSSFQKQRTRRVMLHLIYVNVLIILMDISLLCTEYANLYDIQTTFKGTVYSVKLRLEFAVLNQLMSLTSSRNNGIDLGGYSQSGARGGRNEALETANDQNADSDMKTGTTGRSPGSYTVFAGSSNNGYTNNVKDNSVMKTTEIAIHSEQIRPGPVTKSSMQDSIGTVANDIEKADRPHHAGSTTSSEVDFASKGF